MAVNKVFPELLWAQRSSATDAEKNKLWITVLVHDLKSFDLDVTSTKFKFSGKDAEREYFVEFDLFAEIDTEFTKKVATQQKVVVELRKKEKQEEYWPRLTKDKAKKPFIKTDFDKWVDEDEQDGAPEENDMFAGNDMMNMMGGAGGAGGDMGNMMSMLGGGGTGGDMSRQMEELQKLMAQSQGAQNDEENDEDEAELGKSKD